MIDQYFDQIKNFQSQMKRISVFIDRQAEIEDYEKKVQALEDELARLKFEINIVKKNQSQETTPTSNISSNEQSLISKNLVVNAEVIYADPQNHFISLWIDRGSEEGIELGQPVIGIQNDEVCLIGFVSEVKNHSSQIKTIIDQQTHVSIEIGATGSRAVSQGQSKFNPFLKVNFLDRNLTNIQNEPVYTSGVGGKYPEGILIGWINKIQTQNYGLFQTALLKPAINFFTIKEVLVLQQAEGDLGAWREEKSSSP